MQNRSQSGGEGKGRRGDRTSGTRKEGAILAFRTPPLLALSAVAPDQHIVSTASGAS